MTSRTRGQSASASSTASLRRTSLPRRQAPSAGDDDLGFEVLDAGLQRLGGEAAEDDAVGDAEAGAGQQRDGQLGDHAM